MGKKQVEMTMENQVIQIRYSQGNPVIWCITKDAFSADKEFKRALSTFMQSLDKYYSSGRLLPLHYYFPCQSEIYINLAGVRDVTYMPLSTYQTLNSAQASEETQKEVKVKKTKRKVKEYETTDKE